MTSDEVRTFSESIATAITRTLRISTPWQPGTTEDDHCEGLRVALEQVGWPSVSENPELLPFAGPGGLELGRRLAPLSEIDVLLGGSPLVGDLVRYANGGTHAVRFAGRGLTIARVERSLACPYADAIGVHRVLSLANDELLDPAVSHARINAWVAASVGYCAGVGEFAFDLVLDYARNRRAFGTTLAGLAPVQQMLADVATTVRGLRLLTMDRPGVEALAHAGPALCATTATCQQIAGGIGFTLEFPLQRAYRRARTLTLWNDVVLDALHARTADTA